MIFSEAAAMQSGNVQRLVTADGTYATQSAFSAAAVSAKKDVVRYVYVILCLY